MNRIVSALLCTVLLISCKKDSVVEKASVAEVSYTEDDSKFPNPERGFYKYEESSPGENPNMLDENTLRYYRTKNISLVYRIYYLHAFINTNLTTLALEQIDADMATLRRSGLKCVLRFAYSAQGNEPDAPLNIIMSHLEQLKPVLEKNVDVIAVMQAGFIGAWGEWAYSSNKLTTNEARAAVLDKILETLPSKRMLQVRTPAYKIKYLQRNEPLARNEAFTEIAAARIGHHNDCFLASVTDYGTYENANIEAQKAYVGADALYVPIGGETCPPSGIEPADCQKAEQEMRNLRWSFLNEDYDTNVNNRWIKQGCMDNIIRNLGYRFVLQSAKITDKIAPGNTFHIELKLNNVGYASPYNPRKMELVLKNAETDRIYIAETQENPRLWLPQTLTEISLSAGVPKNLPDGVYDLYINLPDPEPELYGRPDYSIRLANQNVWDETTGYNKLFQGIRTVNNASEPYAGNIYFREKK